MNFVRPVKNLASTCSILLTNSSDCCVINCSDIYDNMLTMVLVVILMIICSSSLHSLGQPIFLTFFYRIFRFLHLSVSLLNFSISLWALSILSLFRFNFFELCFKIVEFTSFIFFIILMIIIHDCIFRKRQSELWHTIRRIITKTKWRENWINV